MNENFAQSISQPLIDELHSRPFLSIEPDGCIAYLALQHSPDASFEENRAPFLELVEALNLSSNLTSAMEAKSYVTLIAGEYVLKWEHHTEFTSFLVYHSHRTGAHFSPRAFDVFPENWLENYRSQIMTSALIEITKRVDNFEAEMAKARTNFVFESFAAAQVLERAAAIATDFRIDENGHIRILLMPSMSVGEKRLGRVVQRLIEIETYVVSSMLGLRTAQNIAKALPDYENEFRPIIGGISSEKETADHSLNALLQMAASVEETISLSSFRFGATKAYAELVEQRIEVLREERLAGFQLFSEFMMRRYEPSMRTVISSQERLNALSKRLERAATFLRTKVEVTNSDGQSELLATMNKRAEAQFRLQETVEGLSVVAISYYAVSLAGYLLAPLAKTWGIDKAWLLALSVPPVVLLVWLFIHGIKKHVVTKE